MTARSDCAIHTNAITDTHVCWQRKALEAEAKKIKTDMQQLITDFHGRLGELANHKLQVQRLIDVAELEMVLLWQAVVRDEDREIRIRQLVRQADTAQLDHKLAGVPLMPVPRSGSLPRLAPVPPPTPLFACPPVLGGFGIAFPAMAQVICCSLSTKNTHALTRP